MRRALAAGAFWLASIVSATAFDLQGHRGARGLAPENTLPAFTTALSIGVTTLELDVGMTRDGILVVSHDPRLNANFTRLDGAFLETSGPALRELTLAEVKRYDVGRLKPGSQYAKAFPDQKPVDGTAFPTLAEVFELARASPVRFNIETKITPTSGSETPDPETFVRAIVETAREAGVLDRITIQSFDWRTLKAASTIAPEVPRVCLTAELRALDNIQKDNPGGSPWTAGLKASEFGGSTPALVKAAGCSTWSPLLERDAGEPRRRQGSGARRRAVDRQRLERGRAPDRLGCRRAHHRLPGPAAQAPGGQGRGRLDEIETDGAATPFPQDRPFVR